MSLDIEECIGHVRSFGLRLKKEQYELMTMQSEMDGLLQAVQATLDVGSVPPVDTERFSLRSPTASLFGLVPFRQFVPGHSASNGDFLMEARSRSAANSIYMGRLNPSASAILDPPMLANIAGMLDMSVEDVMNRSEKQSSAADAVNDRSSMKKTSTQSLLKSLRFSRSSHSRRPSLGLDLDRDRERATTSSQSLRDFENDKVLEKVYHELIGEKMDREANENYHNRTHSLGRPKTTRASSGGRLILHHMLKSMSPQMKIQSF
ncbi:hypothetical protein BC829DRAFT_185303 [Chytridium lagenaria]|nr:hypothetical protein BC829DRAFT_185303 [Chytridium lagenaria]